jgi:hypothetical protein
MAITFLGTIHPIFMNTILKVKDYQYTNEIQIDVVRKNF